MQLKKMSIDHENALDQTHLSVLSQSSFHVRIDANKSVYPEETHLNLQAQHPLSDQSSNEKPESSSTHFMKLPFEVYREFAFSQRRNHTIVLNETLPQVIPGFRDITKSKKFNILDNFEEEQVFTEGTVLEKEGIITSNIYWIVEGEILIYKKIKVELHQMIEQDENLQKEVLSISGVEPLEMFYYPNKPNGTKEVGICLGAFSGNNIVVGEDSALLNKELSYTMVAKKGLLVFKYPTKSAQHSLTPHT